MHNQITTKNQSGKNLSARQNQQGDLKNILAHFFNMFDLTSSVEPMEPKIEVSENKNDVTVSAELPGIEENDINVEISSDGYLTISGEKKNQHITSNEGSYFSEISYGLVRRTVPLPWDLEFDKADAAYDDGVLQIVIPKSAGEQQKKKKISVAHNQKKTRTSKNNA